MLISSYHFRHVPVCVPRLFICVVFLLSFSSETFRNLLSSVNKALNKQARINLLSTNNFSGFLLEMYY